MTEKIGNSNLYPRVASDLYIQTPTEIIINDSNVASVQLPDPLVIQNMPDGSFLKGNISGNGLIYNWTLYPIDTPTTIYTSNSASFDFNNNVSGHPGQYRMELYLSAAGCQSSNIITKEFTVTSTVGFPTYTGSLAVEYNPAGTGPQFIYSSAAVDAQNITGLAIGAYTATFTPKEGYTWANGTTDPYTIDWSITQKIVTAPTVSQSSAFTYDGTTHECTIIGYDDAIMTQTGTTSAINANESGYTVTFTLNDTTNYRYASTAESSVSGTWTIQRAQLVLPSLQTTSFTYSGSVCTPGWNVEAQSYISDGRVTETGTSSATNAGSYTATLSISDTTNYKWTDGTNAPQSKSWSISKATGTLSIDKSSILFSTSTGTTATINITTNSDGAISVSSSNTGVVTVSRSGTVVTVTSRQVTGSATVTISVAASTNYTAPVNSATCSVSCSYSIGSNFATDSWATIFASLQADETVYPIGATKTDTCAGYTTTFMLVDRQKGRYKYSSSGGSNHAVIEISQCWPGTTGFWNANEPKPYNGSLVKSFIDGKFSSLPSALQTEINKHGGVTVYSGPGTTTVTASNRVAATYCKLFAPCAFEIYNKQFGWANSYEGTPQFDWYRIKGVYWTTNREWCVKYGMDAATTARIWWLRSPVEDEEGAKYWWGGVSTDGWPAQGSSSSEAASITYVVTYFAV